MPISMFRWVGAVASLLTLAACAGGTSAGGSEPKASDPAPQARCDAQAAQSFVGQSFSNDTLARLRTAAGSGNFEFAAEHRGQCVRQVEPEVIHYAGEHIGAFRQR